MTGMRHPRPSQCPIHALSSLAIIGGSISLRTPASRRPPAILKFQQKNIPEGTLFGVPHPILHSDFR
jgi:hypothetical protein